MEFFSVIFRYVMATVVLKLRNCKLSTLFPILTGYLIAQCVKFVKFFCFSKKQLKSMCN